MVNAAGSSPGSPRPRLNPFESAQATRRVIHQSAQPGTTGVETGPGTGIRSPFVVEIDSGAGLNGDRMLHLEHVMNRAP